MAKAVEIPKDSPVFKRMQESGNHSDFMFEQFKREFFGLMKEYGFSITREEDWVGGAFSDERQLIEYGINTDNEPFTASEFFEQMFELAQEVEKGQPVLTEFPPFFYTDDPRVSEYGAEDIEGSAMPFTIRFSRQGSQMQNPLDD